VDDKPSPSWLREELLVCQAKGGFMGERLDACPGSTLQGIQRPSPDVLVFTKLPLQKNPFFVLVCTQQGGELYLEYGEIQPF